MKSNEEFIAGIYEKAASYTEEKTNVIHVNFAARAVKIAAMFVVCLGLAGVGVMTVGNEGRTPGNQGVPMSLEDGDMQEGPEVRTLPEVSYLEGRVEKMNGTQIYLRLHNMTEEVQSDAEGALVLVDFAEGIRNEVLCEGMQIKVGGATLEESRMAELGYPTEFAKLVLTVTREQDFFVWSEESETYVYPDSASDKNE